MTKTKIRYFFNWKRKQTMQIRPTGIKSFVFDKPSKEFKRIKLTEDPIFQALHFE